MKKISLNSIVLLCIKWYKKNILLCDFRHINPQPQMLKSWVVWIVMIVGVYWMNVILYYPSVIVPYSFNSNIHVADGVINDYWWSSKNSKSFLVKLYNNEVVGDDSFNQCNFDLNSNPNLAKSLYGKNVRVWYLNDKRIYQIAFLDENSKNIISDTGLSHCNLAYFTNKNKYTTIQFIITRILLLHLILIICARYIRHKIIQANNGGKFSYKLLLIIAVLNLMFIYLPSNYLYHTSKLFLFF